MELMIIGFSAFLGVGIAYIILSPSTARRSATLRLPFSTQGEQLIWIFEGFDLIDATAAARKLFGEVGDFLDWQQLYDQLVRRFPDLPVTPDDVRRNNCTVTRAASQDDMAELVCEWLDGVVRVQIRPSGTTPPIATDNLSEVDVLRIALEHAPYPVWRVESSGSVLWHNKAYHDLCKAVRGASPDLDNPLFPMDISDNSIRNKTRKALDTSDGKRKLWFDVTTVDANDARMFYATDINAVVDAEAAQRKFVQTLSKTFAQLSIGLAIFDRNRQLALFNPALIDLTALPANFLSARPNLLSFFDRLRDQNMMPEPKSYTNWRQQIADLVEAASRGRYQETWTLPSGSVYSVSGRPHPDGAVAFLFEDITAEITLTRRFRSELELNQCVLDSLDSSLSVFTGEGTQTISNAAYRKLWAVDPDATFAQTTVVDALKSWQDLCDPNPVLGDIRDFVMTRDNRTEWGDVIRMKDGSALACNVIPILNGSTLVRFRKVNAVPELPDRQKQLERH